MAAAAAAASAASSTAIGLWCYHSVTAAETESILKIRGDNGSFILRPSNQTKGEQVLSVLHNQRVFHIKILTNNEAYHLQGGTEQFGSLSDLVAHCQSGSCTLSLHNGSSVQLQQPLPASIGQCPEEPWFHRWLSGKQATHLLMQHAEGTYLVRSVEQNRRTEEEENCHAFVLNVRQLECVRHILIKCVRSGSSSSTYSITSDISFSSIKELIEFYRQHPLVDSDRNKIELKNSLNCTTVRASCIDERVGCLSGDEGKGFTEEYLRLSKSDASFEAKTKIEGFKAVNRSKNRFKNILPYDDTRVVLNDLVMLPFNDYINANYISPLLVIPGCNNYIACQGPLESTTPDFWRMVWQERVCCVVMVTNEVEKGKKKCFRYWPCSEEPEVEFDYDTSSFSVTIVNKQEFDEFTHTTLSLQQHNLPATNSKQQQQQHTATPRTVHHFQFTVWPDHGVPEQPQSVLQLIQHVNKQAAMSPRTPDNRAPPIIVHCSAGIGRTGTYIALDLLTHQVSYLGSDCDIDVFTVARHLRSQRPGMIQTEAQYRFLYRAMVYYLQQVCCDGNEVEEVYCT